MASSYEISQMFAQQNQMFMSQGQYAQSIGVPAPPPFMGQVGMGGRGVGASGFGFGAPRGGGFSWGQPRWAGYGPGNTVASGMMSGASAAMSGGSMMLGGAALLGIGGGPMGWAATAAAGGAMAMGAMATGGQQQAQTNTMLGNQYQFFNPMARTGQGFTRDDAKAIGDSIRQLSHIPEMMTSVEELTKMASRLKSSGIMQGVRSAAEFQSRFKEAITTIRDTARILGTTMEEAEQFFTQSRGAGFYGRAAQLKNALNVQFTSGVTGATTGQVMGMQQAGAEMAMQTGARRGLGAQAVTRIAQNIGLAQAEGRISQEQIEDVTGMQGPEAQLALSQKMYAGMMRFGQTAAGRLAMAGMMKYEGGKAVGVDEAMAKRFNQGLVSINELKRRAGGLSEREKISFTARQSDLVSSLAGQIGPGGAFGMMRQALGEGRDEEATNLVMQRLTGMSAGELDIAGGMQGVSGEGMGGLMARMRQRQASQRERQDPRAILQRIKTRIHSATVGRLEQVGADIQNSIAKTVDSFLDDVVGTQVSTLTEEKAKALAQAFSGGSSREAREMLKDATGLRERLGTAGPQTGFGQRGGLGLGARLGLAATGPVGLGITGVSDAMSMLRNVGGPESGLSRFFANISGQMTEGQESESIRRMLGTGDAGKQMALAERLRAGNISGKGAQSVVQRTMAGEGFATKSAVEQMSAITGDIESATRNVLGKLPAGYRDPSVVGKFDESTLENVMRGANLSDDEKSLVRSLSAATKNRVGGMNVYAQMAVASSGHAARAMAGLAGGGGTSLSAMQKDFARAQQNLTAALGETAASFVSGGSKNAKAFQAAMANSDIVDALMGGDLTEAQLKLAAEGIQMSEKDLGALQQSVTAFKKSGADIEKAKAAIQNFGDASNQLAKAEFRKNLTQQGAGIIGAAGTGPAAEAQKALGRAIVGLGEKGEAGIEDYQKSFAAYAQALKGLKGEELQRAIEAGGDIAQQALSAEELVTKFKGKAFGKTADIEKAFGVTAEDIAKVGGKAGQALSEDQLRKLATLGASQRGLVAAQGMVAEKPKSKDEQLIETLKSLSGNQEKIAALLATISGDKDLLTKTQKVLASQKEQGSAGAAGKAEPGK